jgi:hypothetical protein
VSWPPTPSEQVLLSSLGPHTRAHALALMQAHPRLRLTSARRSVERNREVGGSASSFHLRGRACDFVADLLTLRAAHATAHAQRLGKACTGPEEVLLEKVRRPGQHLHVAW